MILLTGATGTVGSALLARLLDAQQPVRCLVRDPERLPAGVQISLGDLADPAAVRDAARGVETVVHLGATIRDRPGASIEQVNALGTLRLLRAAERSGARRFVFFSALCAQLHSRTRFFRAKALAQQAVERSALKTTIFSPSIIYTPGDPWLRLLHRLARLPVMPISGSGQARFQPIWADDVADSVMAALAVPGRRRQRFALAGPQVLTYDDIVRTVLAASGRRRALVHVPLPLVRASLRALGPLAFATWEEAELMEEPMTTPRGTRDAETLGVTPAPIAAVLS